eukprot:5549732-Prymnesium_polylepis.1
MGATDGVRAAKAAAAAAAAAVAAAAATAAAAAATAAAATSTIATAAAATSTIAVADRDGELAEAAIRTSRVHGAIGPQREAQHAAAVRFARRGLQPRRGRRRAVAATAFARRARELLPQADAAVAQRGEERAVQRQQRVYRRRDDGGEA